MRGWKLDERQGHREDVRYYKTTTRQLLRRARWLARYRTRRRDALDLTPRDQARARALPLQYGFRLGPDRRGRTYTSFLIDAPQQPRALEFKRVFRRDSLLPLRLSIEVDGGRRRCRLRYAETDFMTSERAFWEWVGRYVASGVFSRLPRDDADAILQFATAIVEDRLVLRRAVHLREVGHGSGEWLAASTRLVDARDPFVQVGFNLAGSPEAIIYSWSGDTDYHLIEPRHEELGLC